MRLPSHRVAPSTETRQECDLCLLLSHTAVAAGVAAATTQAEIEKVQKRREEKEAEKERMEEELVSARIAGNAP